MKYFEFVKSSLQVYLKYITCVTEYICVVAIWQNSNNELADSKSELTEADVTSQIVYPTHREALKYESDIQVPTGERK